MTPFPPLFQQDTCLPSERWQQRDPSQHFHGSRPRRTKRRWSWIMGDIVYINASVRPEPVPQLGLARARIAESSLSITVISVSITVLIA
ncbi:hypothetical protein ACN38_g501 [Penicillium nordicum]|uniref:Uncharacterized protein n=1 Tax=Penicillium nordicum TaxID=229535 RepID=A0A0M9WKN4_9EURO|nr:hypothetical protein ACN38_g501 [Penicillium nordicum]